MLSQGWQEGHQGQLMDLHPKREGQQVEEVRRKAKGPWGPWRNGYYLWGRLLDLQGLQVTECGIRSMEVWILMGVKGQRRVKVWRIGGKFSFLEHDKAKANQSWNFEGNKHRIDSLNCTGGSQGIHQD